MQIGIINQRVEITTYKVSKVRVKTRVTDSYNYFRNLWTITVAGDRCTYNTLNYEQE